MTQAYDPLTAPSIDEWLSLGEDERIALITEYHRITGVDLPNEHIHAVIHAVVENQIALTEEMQVQVTVERLIREGLDRHEAIHAVGSILVDFLQALFNGDAAPGAIEMYNEELEQLTAAEWLNGFQQET